MATGETVAAMMVQAAETVALPGAMAAEAAVAKVAAPGAMVAEAAVATVEAPGVMAAEAAVAVGADTEPTSGAG